MLEKESSASESEELKYFNHIVQEIQAELNKLGGACRVENQAPLITKIKHKFRVLFEKNYQFLSNSAKRVESHSQASDWTENPVHKKRRLLRFYLDFIQKDIPDLFEKSQNMKEFIIFFLEKENFFMELHNISPGFFDTIKFNSWKKKMLMQAQIVFPRKGKKK